MHGHPWGQGVDSEWAWLLKFCGAGSDLPGQMGEAGQPGAWPSQEKEQHSVCGRRACPAPVLTPWLHPLRFHGLTAEGQLASSLLVLGDQSPSR